MYLAGGKMLNENIVKVGYAKVITMPLNVQHQDMSVKAYKYARERKVGLWCVTHGLRKSDCAATPED